MQPRDRVSGDDPGDGGRCRPEAGSLQSGRARASICRPRGRGGTWRTYIPEATRSECYHKHAAFIIGLTGLPVEPLCYTDEGFADPIREENPPVLQALAEGTRV